MSTDTTKTKAQLTREARRAIDRWLQAIEGEATVPETATVAESNAAGDLVGHAKHAAIAAIIEAVLAGIDPDARGRRLLSKDACFGVFHKGRVWIPYQGNHTHSLPSWYDRDFKDVIDIPLDGFDNFFDEAEEADE